MSSPLAPFTLGLTRFILRLCLPLYLTGSSGGKGGSGQLGGRGGGIFFLNISDTLDIEGTLSANGDNYVTSYAGGGSGGSILIRTKMFEGSGTVQVSYKQVYFYCDSSKLLEENGYEKRQTSMIKTTVLQFMLEAP